MEEDHREVVLLACGSGQGFPLSGPLSFPMVVCLINASLSRRSLRLREDPELLS